MITLRQSENQLSNTQRADLYYQHSEILVLPSDGRIRNSTNAAAERLINWQ